MAYTVNYNRADRSTETKYNLACEQLMTQDFDKNDVLSRNGDFVMTNHTSPTSALEYVTYQRNGITDIYSSLPTNQNDERAVDRNFWIPSKRGIKLYTNVRQVWKFSDPDNPTLPEYLAPVSASLSITVPRNDAVSVNDIKQLIERLIAALFADNEDHIAAMLRGSLNPGV